MKSYSYQYETSPRKLKPEYSSVKRKTTNRKNTKSKHGIQKQTKKSPPKKQEIINEKEVKKEEQNTKKESRNNAKIRFSIFLKCFLIFLIFFLSIYRNSLITQSFAKIQKLKTSITELQKENNQIEINIQNSINTNKVEQAAKELLGMQKLSNRQIVYINLSKKDYIEPRTEEVIIEKDNLNFIQKIIEKIKNMF